MDGQDQLVTADTETKAAGVELRRSALRLEADSRLALGGRLPAVGWTTGVEQLRSAAPSTCTTPARTCVRPSRNHRTASG